MENIWHPFTQMQTASAPIEITSGKGAYVYCADGKKYIDGISSWWVNLHGHAAPHIVKSIQSQVEQLEHVMLAGFTHPPAKELARRLLPLLPGTMNKIFYSDNGSTAVEVALKMSIQYWHNQKIPKHKIIAFKGAYHGDTFGAMSLAGFGKFNQPFQNYLFDVISITPPLPGLERRSFLELQSALSNETACFIFEPLILAAGGMRIYAPDALDPLLFLCKKQGVITIADEVMTGFGRTGTLFACDQLCEVPDLICLSKGLTGGFLPLGATCCSDKIYQAFLSKDIHKAFLHGHSYTGNPIACASALASLDLLLAPACAAQRQSITTSHEKFCEKHGKYFKRCQSLGTVLAVEYHKPPPQVLDSKTLLRPLGNVAYVIPPYCISEEDLTYLYGALCKHC